MHEVLAMIVHQQDVVRCHAIMRLRPAKGRLLDTQSGFPNPARHARAYSYPSL